LDEGGGDWDLGGGRLVDDLFSHWDVFNVLNLSLLSHVFSSISSLRNVLGVGSLYWHLLNVGLLLWNVLGLGGIAHLWNIFHLVFNGIVVSVCSGYWHLFDFLNSFVVGVGLLDWNIFSSGDLFKVLILSLERNILELRFTSV